MGLSRFQSTRSSQGETYSGGLSKFQSARSSRGETFCGGFSMFQSARSFRGETFSVGLSRFQFARSSRGETFSVGALKVSIREKLPRRNIQRGTPKANLELGSSKAKPSARSSRGETFCCWSVSGPGPGEVQAVMRIQIFRMNQMISVMIHSHFSTYFQTSTIMKETDLLVVNRLGLRKAEFLFD